MQECEPRWHKIKIVAPTGEELDRLRQAVELDRELLTVRRQLLELEKQRSVLASSSRCFSPDAEQLRDLHARHVANRSAALSEEHVRTYAAFDEAVLTMRRGYSLETAAVIHGLPEDRCDPLDFPNDQLSFHRQTAVRASLNLTLFDATPAMLTIQSFVSPATPSRHAAASPQPSNQRLRSLNRIGV